MGKGGGFRKYKRSIGRIQREDECRGEEAREVRYGRGKGFQEEKVTRKIYSKDVIWMG